ncbi:MAG: hypothetical protein HRT89_17690, partial [Lentisphaeria bacterium]|nr:aldolase/citrate lyase family protein [Lentisphaeria bacterium]NQZ69891.1 hypothetical protein [Lentisphaeria bacterium]
MEIAKKLLEKINQGELVTGVLATDHIWPGMTELLKSTGLDYLMIDYEHGPHDQSVISQICDIGRMIDFPILIRPVSTDKHIVRRMIDLGPCGLMFPSIESTEQLDEARDAIWMPPRGRRRPGGIGNRWVEDFNYETWKEVVEDNFIVLAQIESQQGVDCIDAIASHDIVSSLALGPYDLSADLGCCGDPDDPKLIDAMLKVKQAGEKHGMKTWCLGADPMAVKELGFTFLCIGVSCMMLKQKVKDVIGLRNDEA